MYVIYSITYVMKFFSIETQATVGTYIFGDYCGIYKIFLA